MIIILLFSLAQAAAPLKPLGTGFCNEAVKTKCEHTSTQVSVLTRQEAQNLFRDFREMPGQAREYIMDGCFARTHQMVRLAEKRGLILGKVFFHGVLRPTKRPPFKDPMSGRKNPDASDAFWSWHVAPIVYVMDEKGKTEPLVLDPAITNGPTPVESYRKMLLGEGEPPTRIVDEYFGSRYQFVNRLANPIAAASYSENIDEVAKNILSNYENLIQNVQFFDQKPKSEATK